MNNNHFLEWPFFDDSHRRLAGELQAWVHTHRHTLEADGVDEKQAVRSLCVVRDVLARCSGLADCTFAMQGLDAVPLVLFGSAAQQAAHLPRIADGSCITGFCLSESEAGSDVSALQTSARHDQGAGEYVLNGRKTWISNAGVAHTYIVFARTGESGSRGLSAFVVDADTPGLSVPESINVVAPHVIGTVAFDDCRVPASQMPGKPGDGFKVAMATLDVMRTTVGAAALGFARRALGVTVGSTVERLYREIRPLRIYEGTSEIQKLIIAGQVLGK